MAGSVHALVITYRRPTELAVALDALARQSRPLDSVLVVDNDADPAVEHLVVAAGAAYLPMPENTGPAGAIAAGLAEILHRAGDDDWVLLVDDDDPPRSEDVIGDLVAFGSSVGRCGVAVGGVGLVGGRFDRRTGRLHRLDDELLTGAVRVDYIGTGQCPLYAVRALRRAGAPAPELFFGFEDLHLGLRLRDAGFGLYVDGDAWRAGRQQLGRAGLSARQVRRRHRVAPWRRYYSTRNLVWIAKQQSVSAGLLATVRSGLLAAVADLWRARSVRATTPALRGVVDAWRNHLGRTVEPGASPTWRRLSAPTGRAGTSG